jgi:hypothetical protein
MDSNITTEMPEMPKVTKMPKVVVEGLHYDWSLARINV